jgi:hypothetical protein
MSRTTLCILTAAVLASCSLGVCFLRLYVLGEETRVPPGPGNYQVRMLVRGKGTGAVKLITACPLDFHRQHVFAEESSSAELHPKSSELRGGERRQIQWSERVGASKGTFLARYEFSCSIDVHRPNSSMLRLKRALYSPPKPGEHLASGPGIDPGSREITDVALDLTWGVDKAIDQSRALFQYAHDHLIKEPAAGTQSSTALECLKAGRGDALARSRLLVALCRNRGIPARLVTGLMLAKRHEQKAHVWVEAWLGDGWLPMCATHNHCGRVPSTYLIFGFGDAVMARGQNVRDLDYAFLVEPQARPRETAEESSPFRAVFHRVSLYSLPPAEMRLVEFLLLLPVAALIICLYRNVIGLQSFGTFAPALIGLAFRELASLPGILVFVSILLVGWGMRRVLDRYHLLQVPRTAFMLSLVVVLLIGGIMAANYQDLAATHYISLFPLVILTGMIERFWTLETEDGTSSSFKTLLSTMLIALSISLLLSIPAIVDHMVHFPETLGLVMAAQLLIGRYTGFRLSELIRFRDFLNQQPARS